MKYGFLHDLQQCNETVCFYFYEILIKFPNNRCGRRHIGSVTVEVFLMKTSSTVGVLHLRNDKRFELYTLMTLFKNNWFTLLKKKGIEVGQ